MTPVDQYATLRALVFGLEQAIEGASDDALAFRLLTGAKSFVTQWGEIVFRKGDPSIVLPPGPLLEWARQAMPHEVVEEKRVETVVPATVRPSLRETLLGKGKKPGRFRLVGDEVIDSETGEVVEWAVVAPADPSPVFNMSDEGKDAAELLVRTRLNRITAAAIPEVES